jgi:carbonic anhydrase/acetyltransferase-like protein (isoleucine patch superfamily)
MERDDRWKRLSLLARGYFFYGRNLLAAKVTNKLLDLAAFLDYRLLMLLSMWHPDPGARLKLLRRRGVKISEKAWVDLGVWIEMTTPQHVIIEDYAKLAYGCIVFAHDAAVNSVADLPMRVQTTRIGYNAAIGARSIIMPGVSIGKHSGVMPGSVVTRDVPDMTIVGGVPAEKYFTAEELGLAWQADMKKRPDIYYDHPNPARAPSTPLDHLITWRKEGVKVRDYRELRTGTPFDFILEAKEMKEGKR